MKAIGLIGRWNTTSHHAAAAAVEDGRLLFAIEEERLSRNKLAFGLFPLQAVGACLDFCGWSAGEVDAWAFGWDYARDTVDPAPRTPEAIADRVIPALLRRSIDARRVAFVDHHVAHLVSGYLMTEDRDAAGLIVDGRGEDCSVSLYRVDAGRPTRIGAVDIPHSPGLYYQAVAEHCGLGLTSAGKLMGLASYGRPLADRLYRGEEHIRPPVEVARFDRADPDALWRGRLADEFPPFQPNRKADQPLVYVDLAATAQRDLEESLLGMARWLRDRVRLPTLIGGGGVFLNCPINNRLMADSGFESLAVFPAANDAGAAVGAALEVGRARGIDPRPLGRSTGLSLGLRYDREDERACLGAFGLRVESDDPQRSVERAVDHLSDGRIVLFFAGRSEFGPRALCQRSILASPASHDALLELNRIKRREYWRPLAPVVLDEDYAEVFETPRLPLMDAMLATATVRPSWRRRIPAVVHQDGTSRPQVLPPGGDHPVAPILRGFRKRSGLPCLINTSMNVGWQPICERPMDAMMALREFPRGTAIYMDGLFAVR